MRIIGVVGQNGSGKDEVLKYLRDRYNIPFLATGDAVREIAKNEGREPTRENLKEISKRYFREMGEGCFVRLVAEKIRRLGRQVAGISGIGSSVAYAASKGALNTITYSLARALAPLIRVNTVCPGYIDTPWFTKGRGVDGAAKVRDSVVSKVPLKRASTAEDVAGLVCFLATPASSNMTGEIVRMDAGAHLIA